MSSGPFFLSIQQVLAIHRRVVEEFGGDPGIRDAGLLESAVAMPAAQVAGEFLHEDLFAMAAAYLFHLCKNHPFLDGNKRTALSSALVFLVLNETELDASDEQLEELTVGIAEGRLSKDDARGFFRRCGGAGGS